MQDLYLCRTEKRSGARVSIKKLCRMSLIMYLSLKPLIDLTWRFKYMGFNIQSALNLVFPVTLASALFVMSPLRLYFERRTILLFIFVAFVLLSIVANPTDLQHASTSARLLLNVIILYALIATFDTENLLLMTKAFAVSVLIICVLGIMQVLGFLPYEYYMYTLIPGIRTGRLSGTYSHPSEFLRVVVFYIILYLCFLRVRNVWYYKLVYFASLISFLLTFHRAGITIVLLLHLLDNFIEKKFARLGLLSIALLAIVAFNHEFFYYTIIKTRLNFEGGIEDTRFGYAIESMRLFKQADIVGKIFGSGSFPEGRLYGDCDYARILYSHGLFALVAYIGFIASLLLVALRQTDSVRKKIILYPTVTLLLMSITMDPLRYPSFLVFFFAFVSVGLKMSRTRLPFVSSREGWSVLQRKV